MPGFDLKRLIMLGVMLVALYILSMAFSAARDTVPRSVLQQEPPQIAQQIGRALLVDNVKVLLVNDTERDKFFRFIVDHGITELGLYMFGPPAKRVLPELPQQLSQFMAQAKNAWGITTLTAIGGAQWEFDAILDYQKNAPLAGKFDALWLEYEYWNNTPRDFDKYLQLLEYMRNIGQGLPVGAYLGWPKQFEVQSITQKADRIFLHCYVNNGQKTYDYCRSRLAWFGALARRVEIWPLFSAEWRPFEACNSKNFPPDKEPSCFMGPWLNCHGFNTAEGFFISRLQNERSSWKTAIDLDGFYYFAYTHAQAMMSDDKPVASCSKVVIPPVNLR